jgi:hypothetical protein
MDFFETGTIHSPDLGETVALIGGLSNCRLEGKVT